MEKCKNRPAKIEKKIIDLMLKFLIDQFQYGGYDNDSEIKELTAEIIKFCIIKYNYYPKSSNIAKELCDWELDSYGKRIIKKIPKEHK